MLLVLGAEPAVVGTASLDPVAESERDRARPVEAGVAYIGIGIGVDQRLEAAVLGAALAHEDLALA